MDRMMTERQRQLTVRALRHAAEHELRLARRRTFAGEGGKPYRDGMRKLAREYTELADQLCREPEQ